MVQTLCGANGTALAGRPSWLVGGLAHHDDSGVVRVDQSFHKVASLTEKQQWQAAVSDLT